MSKKIKKWVSFYELPQAPSKKTKVWTIYAIRDNARLGEIRWNSGWRRYWFLPDKETGWDSSCLIEVSDFINQQMILRLIKRMMVADAERIWD